jgi:hypothetical protein
MNNDIYQNPYTDDKLEYGLPDLTIPAGVLECEEISNTEKLLFGYIRNYEFSANGCFASNEKFAKLLKCSAGMVSHGISHLVKAGLIFCEYRQVYKKTTQRFITTNPEIYARTKVKRDAYLQNKEDRPLAKNSYPPYTKSSNNVSNNNVNKVIKPKKPFSEKTPSFPIKSFSIFNKVTNSPAQTRSEGIAAYFFQEYSSVNGNHPSVTDEQMINGLANIERYMVKQKYDNDRIVEIVDDFFRSKVLLDSGADFKWNLFTSENILKARCREREETDEIKS